MAKNYIYYPRNFSNEYALIRIEDASEEARLLAWYEEHGTEQNDLHRITVRNMRQKVSAERWARKYDQAFSGFGDVEPQSVDEFLAPIWGGQEYYEEAQQ